MKYTTLPNTEIEVSKICLGTMTLVNKIRAEGHEQMDYALEKELILDTAEMYSVPAREETYGDTEKLLEPGSKNRKKKRWFSLLK
jgi:aryl-alcohol dehydrogenase-like predicted oxidoreductase